MRYPVFISLESLRVLVVGAGVVGRRKLASLCEADVGDVLVLDPDLSEGQVGELAAMPNVRVERRTMKEADIEGKTLVFVATNNAEENARIAGLCATHKVLCNVADSPVAGTFHVAARADVGGITAAFSTGGGSPALAKRIRAEAPEWLRSYCPLLTVLERLRPLVLTLHLPTGENSAIFRSIAYSRLGDALAAGDTENAKNIAAAILPAALHEHIEELLHGID